MDNEEKHICEEEGCGKTFDSASQLRGHMMSHKRQAKKDKKPELTTPEQTPRRVLTPEEEAIVRRVESEERDWETIGEESMVDFSLSEDPFKLPREAQERQDRREFAFRWALRKPERVDSLRTLAPPQRWMIVNKQTCPWINDRDIDPILGCVCRLTQMLFFKPWSWHMRVKEAKNALADGVDSRSVKNKHGIQDENSEWLAGDQYKISGGDQVFGEQFLADRENNLNEQMGVSYGSSAGVTEE